MGEMVWPDKPWTKRQIHDLREAIVSGGEESSGISYSQIASWYGDVLASVAQLAAGVNTSGLDVRDLRVSSRVKTVETLRDKLKRDPTIQIPRIRDVMDVRIAAEMSMRTQDEIVKRVGDVLPVFKVSDTRREPHSGYRAVHAIVKLPDGVFCEVQVRTSLQDAWANCYELAGDIYGRAIRYGGKPDHDDHGLVSYLLNLSEMFSIVEFMTDMTGLTDAARTQVRRSVAVADDLAAILESNREDLKAGLYDGVGKELPWLA